MGRTTQIDKMTINKQVNTNQSNTNTDKFSRKTNLKFDISLSQIAKRK